MDREVKEVEMEAYRRALDHFAHHWTEPFNQLRKTVADIQYKMELEAAYKKGFTEGHEAAWSKTEGVIKNMGMKH